MNKAALAQFANILGTSLPADAIASYQPEMTSGYGPPAPPPNANMPAAMTVAERPLTPADMAQEQSNRFLPASPLQPTPPQNIPVNPSRPDTAPAAAGPAAKQKELNAYVNEADKAWADAEAKGEVPTAGDRGFAAGMPAGPQYIEAGFDARRLPYRPESLARQEAAREGQTAAFITSNRVAEEGARKQAAELQYYADMIEDRNRQSALEEQARQQRYADLRDRAAKLSEEAASVKVQPGRLFADNGAGFGIMAAIGGALGGILQARQGGENQFLKTLDTMIDRDISAQKANIMQGHEKASAAREDYQALRTQLGDERLAEEVHRQRIGNWVGARIQAVAANTNSDLVRERANMALQDLEAWKADRQMQMDPMMYRAAMMVGGQAPQPTDRSLTVRMPDGRAYEMPTKESADKIRANLGYTLQMQENINQALAIRKSASAADLANPLSTVSKQLKALAADTAEIVTVRKGQGAMSKGDRDVADDSVGAMRGLMSNNDDVLRSSHSRFGKQMQLELRGSGAEEIQAGYRVTPMGQTQTTRQYTGSAVKPPPAMPTVKPLGSK